MASSRQSDDLRYRGKKGSPEKGSAERNAGSGDDTDKPSMSPFSLSFFKLGLPTAGYIMLVTEIIPSFTYLALSHFHVGGSEYDASVWFGNHFFAVLFAIPASFMIAILSDGYTYGKFISSIVMQTMMFLTGLCSLLDTVTAGFSSTAMWFIDHLSVYSIFVFYVALPIRVTIFTDVFAKDKSHERARKAFSAYWVFNLTGVTILTAVYQYFFERDDKHIQFILLLTLLTLNFVYFLVTCAILMTLPLELSLKNQFIFHIRCIWYAVRHQPPKAKRQKNYDWLEPALEKYTQTEVKRSRSLFQLMLLIFPIISYAAGHTHILFNWYNYGHNLKWFGQMSYAYNCFYSHMMFTIIFICLVEVIFLPIAYHCCGHFKGIWLLLLGYFLMGIPLSSFVAIESTCSYQNTTRYYKPAVRLINGYPDKLLVYSDWLGPDGGKGRASVPPGEVLTIQPPSAVADGTYGEATIFAYPSMKVVDFLVMATAHGISSTYFLSPFHNQHLELRDYDVRVSPEVVLYGVSAPRKGTIIMSCSPDLYDEELDLRCTYNERGVTLALPVEHLCRTKTVHNGVTMETRPVLTVLNWPARVYTCRIDEETMELEIEIDDFASIHLASHIDPATMPRALKKFNLHNLAGERIREAYLVLTNLDILHCRIPLGVMVLQLIVHSLSAALVLVSCYTIHCLHGPPRMRMTSYALPHIAAYTGVCIERGILNHRNPPITEAIIFEVMWAVGFVGLTLIAVFCKFEFHSWDIPRRPSMFWKMRAWLNIRLHYRSVVKDKPPDMTVSASPNKSGKGIIRPDDIKDKTVDDDKTERKVTFVEE